MKLRKRIWAIYAAVLVSFIVYGSFRFVLREGGRNAFDVFKMASALAVFSLLLTFAGYLIKRSVRTRARMALGGILATGVVMLLMCIDSFFPLTDHTTCLEPACFPVYGFQVCLYALSFHPIRREGCILLRTGQALRHRLRSESFL